MEIITKIAYFAFTKSIGLYINLMSFIVPEKAGKLAYKFFSEPRSGKLFPNTIPPILKEAQLEVILHHSGGIEFNIPQYAEHLNALVQKFQPQYIIGHSMGGATCLYYQYKYNNPILQKMVIMGAPSEFDILLSNYKKTIGLNNRAFQLLKTKFVERFDIQPSDFSGKKFASTFSLKGLIAHDIDDNVVAFNEGQEIANAWKSSLFIQTKGLGHSLHDDLLYQKISNFLFEAE
jgi:predicted alpha/beta hydrolase family esterase